MNGPELSSVDQVPHMTKTHLCHVRDGHHWLSSSSGTPKAQSPKKRRGTRIPPRRNTTWQVKTYESGALPNLYGTIMPKIASVRKEIGQSGVTKTIVITVIVGVRAIAKRFSQ